MESALETLQLASVDLISKRTFFQPVPVMHERTKNVRAELASALNRLKGIAILVLTPIGNNPSPATPGPRLDITLTAEVAENVIINTGKNGTQLPCSLVAEQIAAWLHLEQWTAGKTLVCKDIKIVPNKALVVYRVAFDTGVQLARIGD